MVPRGHSPLVFFHHSIKCGISNLSLNGCDLLFFDPMVNICGGMVQKLAKLSQFQQMGLCVAEAKSKWVVMIILLLFSQKLIERFWRCASLIM